MSRKRRPVTAEVLTGLPPLTTADAQILILGSMPGTASLLAQQYYAHRHNHFWRFMAAITGIALDGLPYAARADALLSRRIAVWDVLKHCERPGSLDADIVKASEVANDFAAFFAAHPQLRAVFFNGAKAATAYARHVQHRSGVATLPLRFVTLPSTSPANASQSAAIKQAAWMQIRAELEAAG